MLRHLLESAVMPGDAYSTEMTHVPRLVVALCGCEMLSYLAASGPRDALLRERMIGSTDHLWLRGHALRLPHAEVTE